MKYSTLIRRLVRASEEAKYRQEDISEILRERCVEGTDIIRQTLMNVVCDPRFKMHVSVLHKWRQRAQDYLEAFAEKLMRIPYLTVEAAYFEMDEMLNEWLRRAMEEAQLADNEGLRFTMVPRNPSDRSYLLIRKALDKYVNEGIGADEIKESDMDELPPLKWNGEQADENEDGGGNKDEDEDEGEDDAEDKSEMEQDESFPVMNPFVRSRKVQKEVEDRFLTQVPPSLIRLAKLIGRSGDGIMSTEGTFSTASKSDIGGITTGDDLNSLLPSELALLSESSTQRLFYKNYITKRLQVFASMSHESKGKKHRDGPIIICMDASGSMEGDPVLVAKALTVAICIIAQRKRRRVLVIKYSNSHDMFTLRNIEQQRTELLSFLSTAELAGNDENSLFTWLFEEVLPYEQDYDCADILCISDFGWAPIEEDTMSLIKEEKKKGVLFYGLNIANGDDGIRSPCFGPLHTFCEESNKGTPKDVCDSLWEYRDGVCRQVYSD